MTTWHKNPRVYSLFSLVCIAACSAILSPFEKSEQDSAMPSRPGADRTGTLEIIFNQTGISTVLPPEVAPDDLEFNLTLTPADPAQEPIEVQELPAGELSLPGIPEGTWNISLRGYFPEGTPLEGVIPNVYAFGASSQDPIEITAGLPTTWVAQLLAIQSDEGEGSVRIELSWNPELFPGNPGTSRVTNYEDDADALTPSLQLLVPGQAPEDREPPFYIDPADEGITITFDADQGTLTYEQDNLPSGFYRIAIPLERHDSETGQTYAVGTYRDVIHIYDGRRSEKDLEITPLIGTPPSAPENLQLSPVSFDETEEEWTVGLSWTRTANTALSYRIYRRVNDGAFEVLDGATDLPRDTSFFSDTFEPADLDDTYQYRVIAANSYGTSSPLASPVLSANPEGNEGDFLFTVHSDYLILTGYTGAAEDDVIIPPAAEVGGVTRTVRTIAASAFEGKQITGTLTIADSVTEIGRLAFNTNNFTGNLVIPDSVTTIKDNAFRNAGFGGSLTLGENLETIEVGAFRDNQFTGGLTIPGSITSMGTRVFQEAGFTGPLNLENLSLTSIEANTFTDTGFTGTLVIPESVQTIGVQAFQNANFTGSLVISDSVTTVGNAAFQNAGFDGSLTLGENLETIGPEAFRNNQFTGGLTIPGSVAFIGASAFRTAGFTGPLNLENLSLTSIEITTFADTGLTGTLVIPESVQTIGGQAFMNTNFTGNLVIPDAVTTVGNAAFRTAGFDGTLTLGENLETIGSDSFRGNQFTGGLTIPGSIASMGPRAFQSSGFTGTLNLESLVLTSIPDNAFQATGFTGSLEIPISVTTIGISAFEDSKFDGTLTLPSGLTGLANGAFRTNNFTGNLEIPGTLTSVAISAFSNAGFTGALTLNEGIQSIGAFAFVGTGFTGDLVVPDSVISVGNQALRGAFDGTLTLGENLVTIGSTAFSPSGSGFSGQLTIPESVTTIGVGAFAENTFENTELLIPASVESVGAEAFTLMANLETVIVNRWEAPDGITTAGVDLFQGSPIAGGTGSILVPAGSETAYKEADGWNQYSDIIEEKTTELVISSGTLDTIFPTGTTFYYDLIDAESYDHEGSGWGSGTSPWNFDTWYEDENVQLLEKDGVTNVVKTTGTRPQFEPEALTGLAPGKEWRILLTNWPDRGPASAFRRANLSQPFTLSEGGTITLDDNDFVAWDWDS
ncbi:Leucine rich repeat-containing protein [Alkalispirochaeta americana]|uniref:Leucine rich repeat-containing protein n=1 Tax=Alkalispirochaeta americana TaxID=159291 RepID=A0A1N6PPV7_9SPIO|nr:leucine-rich repeat protein [Alkalispirochaeta americana]SIQ06313.1 Leucine rich repeat-containing protein [Alkalispirochaeta americana]